MPFEIELPLAGNAVTNVARSDLVAAPRQFSDVHMFHTPDGGEIRCVGGVVELSNGYEAAVYLSLFGGNAEDRGLQADNAKQWWGNLIETEPARMYRSETQSLLRGIPSIPANLRLIEEAAARDLAWLMPDYADVVSPRATMPALNRVKLQISVVTLAGVFEYFFDESWRAAA
jgi:phage gp46-like protein